MKVVLYSFYIFLALVLPLQNPRPGDYILMEFGGMPRDKAVLTVVFSIENFEREFGLTPAIKVDKCEYLSICDVIRESNSVKKLDTTDAAFYKFWIVRHNRRVLFGTFTFDATKSVFDGVTEQIKKPGRRNEVKETLQDILRQIR